MKKRFNYFKHHLKIVLLLSIFIFSGCSEYNVRVLTTIDGKTMGTGYEIKLVTTEMIPESKYQSLKSGIDSLLDVINSQMSAYLDSSEISLFNRYQSTDWFPVSVETAEIILKSLEVSEKSNGAFDITVGPLVNLWGFGPEPADSALPDSESISRVKQYTGYDKISARLSPPSVMKKVPGLYCDLAAIAKGHGVDRIAEFLESKGMADYMVEIGGEINAKGVNPEGTTWQIGISIPENSSGVQKIIPLLNTSMATSGDYRFYFEKNGTRYSHIINPASGQPIKHKLASVTVIHPSCAYADAMATAIIVLGPEEGYKLAVKENLPVFMIIREDTAFVEKMNPHFMQLY